jgi:hypothetical protein
MGTPIVSVVDRSVGAIAREIFAHEASYRVTAIDGKRVCLMACRCGFRAVCRWRPDGGHFEAARRAKEQHQAVVVGNALRVRELLAP